MSGNRDPTQRASSLPMRTQQAGNLVLSRASDLRLPAPGTLKNKHPLFTPPTGSYSVRTAPQAKTLGRFTPWPVLPPKESQFRAPAASRPPPDHGPGGHAKITLPDTEPRSPPQATAATDKDPSSSIPLCLETPPFPELWEHPAGPPEAPLLLAARARTQPGSSTVPSSTCGPAFSPLPHCFPDGATAPHVATPPHMQGPRMAVEGACGPLHTPTLPTLCPLLPLGSARLHLLPGGSPHVMMPGGGGSSGDGVITLTRGPSLLPMAE